MTPPAPWGKYDFEEKMEAISEAVSKDDVNKLLAQGRFLEDRFGTNSELSLEPAKPS